jgi:hypothetical protein
MAAILNDLQTVFIQNFLALYKYIIYNTKLHMLICCGTFITATKQIRKLYFVLPRGTHIFYKNTTFRLHKLLKCANNTNSSCTLFIGITLHLSVCEYRQTDRQTDRQWDPHNFTNNRHRGSFPKGRSKEILRFIWPLTLIVLTWRIGWAHNNARK